MSIVIVVARMNAFFLALSLRRPTFIDNITFHIVLLFFSLTLAVLKDTTQYFRLYFVTIPKLTLNVTEIVRVVSTTTTFYPLGSWHRQNT